MKRALAAALAAASVGGTLLTATPAFAGVKPVTLKIKPRQISNGEATAITGKCLNKLASVKITSPALNIDASGHVGKELKVEFDAGWGLQAGKYEIKAQCFTFGVIPGFSTWKSLRVKHAEPPTPPKPPKPPVPPMPPIKPIPGFHPDVVVHTGFGGMAGFVANHHPVG
jgi:hypothetical protein